ncbi:ATP-binding cassette domain-containing protein [Streptomyces noursei]|uniref:ATP-binding cassette domain-containing protein n=1 Tax=Streptomyces noursei TaxID=1971 RepID=UPI000C9CEC28|nr:ATP-binding cassette domain-containing protein [Streptomyces noursei]
MTWSRGGAAQRARSDEGFPGRRVLCGVSLDLPPGRVTGFLGANGAGKTTAIRMLPGAGETLFMGRLLAAWRDPARVADARGPGGAAGGSSRPVAGALSVGGRTLTVCGDVRDRGGRAVSRGPWGSGSVGTARSGAPSG